MSVTLSERFHSARRDPGRVVLEGFHPVKHALRFGATLEALVRRDDADLAGLCRRLAPDLGDRVGDARAVSAREFEGLAPQPPETGLIAIAMRPPERALEVAAEAGRAPAVLLEEPTRLGNLGAAVRVAAAAGAEALVSIGRHDPWSPEAVRGGAGLQFALPVARCDRLPQLRRPLVALTPDGRPLGRQPLPTGALLAFGNERDGLSPALLERADLKLSIPMRAGVSSLNLATAVAVCLYAWRLAGPPGPLHRAQFRE